MIRMLFYMLLLASSMAYAQVKPIYFIGDSIVANKEKATAYGIFGKVTSEELYVLKMYDLSNNLLLTGSYKDETLKVPEGRFFIYREIQDFNDENGTNFFSMINFDF